jgi:hypothetical protein
MDNLALAIIPLLLVVEERIVTARKGGGRNRPEPVAGMDRRTYYLDHTQRLQNHHLLGRNRSALYRQAREHLQRRAVCAGVSRHFSQTTVSRRWWTLRQRTGKDR